MIKVTSAQLRKLALDEAKSAEMYRKMGFRNIARVEANHAQFFKYMAARLRR